MKIALVGYGKMGRAIEKMCIDKGHSVTEIFDSKNPFLEFSNINADVAIEFTQPKMAVKHINHAIKMGIPMVVGTTGWLEQIDEVKQLTLLHNGSLVYATNFSLGVNVFQVLVEKMAEVLSNFPEYQFSIEEIHHIQKLDSPSGTAITLAESVINNHQAYAKWHMIELSGDESLNQSVPMGAIRMPEVPGTHKVSATSQIDSLILEHVAHSRHGFAAGSIMAAEWLLGKKGIFTMKDVLQL